MNVTKRFLDASQCIWEQYHNHPFVQGIAKGNLDKAKFKHYIIQDYLYLIDYAKVFSIGAGKAQDMETMQFFSRYAHQIFNYETDIHKGYVKEFGVLKEELDNTKMSLDNLSYTSYMLRLAYEGGAVEALVAVMACGISYEVIAKKIILDNPGSENDSFYGAWISGYASDVFHEGNEKMRSLVERLTEGYNEKQIENLTEIFVACSKYELEFWNMAWELR